jgi:twinkle protein
MAQRKTSAAKKDSEGTENTREKGSEAAGEPEDGAHRGVIGVDFYARDYFRDRNHRMSEKDGRISIACPACRGRGKPLVVTNDLGTWKCGKCARRGSFDELRRLLGDVSVNKVDKRIVGQADMLIPSFAPVRYHRDYQNELWGAGKAKVEWLAGKGVGEDLIRGFRLGYNKEFDALVFPYLYRRAIGSTSYIRMLREPSDWWKVVGDPITASWFGQHRFKSGHKEAIIVQTPLDALVLTALGEDNVLSAFVDTRRVRIRAHGMALLQRCEVVYIAPNPSDEGLDWARVLQEQLGAWRCRIVQLDAHVSDVANVGVWDSAKAKAVENVGVRVGDVTDWFEEVDRVYEQGDAVKGYPTMLEPLDKLLGGWRDGEVTVLAGEPGAGKSTLAGFLSLLQGGCGRSVLHMTFEVRPGAMVRKWVQMLGGNPVQEMSRSDYVSARRKLARMSLMLPAVQGSVCVDEVVRVVSDAVSRFGVGLVVVDHLGFVDEGVLPNNLIRGSKAVIALKKIALEFGVHILLLCHMRKRQSGDVSGKFGLSDVLGAGEITQFADNVMFVRRPKDIGKEKANENPAASANRRTIVDLVKIRDDSGFEGKVVLGFDVKTLRFRSLLQ